MLCDVFFVAAFVSSFSRWLHTYESIDTRKYIHTYEHVVYRIIGFGFHGSYIHMKVYINMNIYTHESLHQNKLNVVESKFRYKK